jgi:hypothetical protein
MPSLVHVFIGALAAAVYCTAIGLAFARQIIGGRLAWAIAPALGWALQSAAALPVFLLMGFSVTSVALVCAVMLLGSLLLLNASALKQESDAHVPAWACAAAAVIAVAPAAVLIPKTPPEGIALATPIFDHAKVAIIDQIARGGLPAQNPFFAAAGEPSSLAYYYLWHFSAAELSLLAGSTGWEADAALTWFTAFAALMLMAALAAWLSDRASSAAWVLPFAVSGSLRPLLALAFGGEALDRVILPAWGLGSWFYQAGWAPQHIAGASSAVLAMFVIAHAARRRSWLLLAVLALLAAAACQSSAWIGGVLFPIAALLAGITIFLHLPAGERRGFVVWAGVAALLALGLAAPFLHEQLAALALREGATPIVFEPYEVLGSAIPQSLRRVLDVPAFWLALLPIEFPAVYIAGTFGLGWLLLSAAIEPSKKLSILILAELAATGLVIACLFASKVADNNDLGWRSALTAFVVLIIFAAAVMPSWFARPRRVLGGFAIVLLLAGAPATQGNISGDLAPRPTASARIFAETPALWAAVRRHTQGNERVANNPLFMADMTGWPVNMSWALMANRASCFAGRELAMPFVAIPQARTMELEHQFERIFEGHPQPDDLRELATRYDCRLVVVTPQDGAWTADPFAASPLFQIVESNDKWRFYRQAPAN